MLDQCFNVLGAVLTLLLMHIMRSVQPVDLQQECTDASDMGMHQTWGCMLQSASARTML